MKICSLDLPQNENITKTNNISTLLQTFSFVLTSEKENESANNKNRSVHYDNFFNQHFSHRIHHFSDHE